MDRRHRQSVRRRGGRSERGPRTVDDVRRARGAVQSQSVQLRKRGTERHDAATQRVQAGHPTGQDRRRHRRPGQDIGFQEQPVRIITIATDGMMRFSIIFSLAVDATASHDHIIIEAADWARLGYPVDRSSKMTCRYYA